MLGDNFTVEEGKNMLVCQINTYVTAKLLPEKNKSSSLKTYPLSINKDGQLVSSGKTSEKALSRDKFSNVALFIDPVKNFTKVYLDGELVIEGTYLSANDIKNLTFTIEESNIVAKGGESYIPGIIRLFQKTYSAGFTGADVAYDNAMVYFADEYYGAATRHKADLQGASANEDGTSDLYYFCDICGLESTVTSTGKVIDAGAADADFVVLGRQGSLGENIGFKLYTEIGAAAMADKSAKIVLSVGDTVTEYPVSMLRRIGGSFVLPINFATTEMTKTISAKLVTSAGETAAYETTFEEYAKALIATSSDEKLINLVKATLSLGAYAQDYFGELYGGEYPTPPEKYYEKAALEEADALLAAAYAFNMDDQSASVDALSATLVLDDKTTVKVFFSGEATGVTVNGEAAQIVKSGDKSFVKIEELLPHELGDKIVVVITSADGFVTINLSVLDLAHLVVTGDMSDAFKNVARSLYYYCKCAEAYKA